MKKILLSCLTILFFANIINIQEVFADEQNVPRMVSIRAKKMNARKGPGQRYPVSWEYSQRGAPLEIISEFELWRKVKDWENSESWVHSSMLSSRRTAKVTTPGENNVYSKPSYDSKIIAKVEDGVVGDIKKCEAKEIFCLVKFGNIEGYIARKNIFGVYKDEVIK